MERRKLLKYSAGGIAGLACIGGAGAFAINRWVNSNAQLNYAFPPYAGNGPLAPTPACGTVAQKTLGQMEGPYYTPDTPLRTSLLEEGIPGTPMVLEGMVLDTQCRPIPGAVIDFWNCDGEGTYDNEGFTLRGHQFTDEAGCYRLETIRPVDYYDGVIHRTPHIHVKVQGPKSQLLTTQLYFAGHALNDPDILFDERLLMRMEEDSDGSPIAKFDFVLS